MYYFPAIHITQGRGNVVSHVWKLRRVYTFEALPKSPSSETFTYVTSPIKVTSEPITIMPGDQAYLVSLSL